MGLLRDATAVIFATISDVLQPYFPRRHAAAPVGALQRGPVHDAAVNIQAPHGG